ncbi:extracellular triacylglycerol lipase precursor [Mycena sp. CBHHK59/15]|nr:extracellular triacylglycerol lipase precursor [Mycena sp. CBHHK59/15]
MLSLFVLFASLAELPWGKSVPAGPTIQLGKTTLVGRDIAFWGQEFFGGIPYARPPLGNLRLRPPVLTTSLDDNTFNATQFGLACLQLGLPASEISEDCLTINVLRPSGTPSSEKLPVMFWTYGGGFIAGQADIVNASALVAQSVVRGTPIVYVNFNYRLGPLGFAQGQEADNRGAVNLGLRDQIAALQWVQKNIGLFGGDPMKVTIFGESAGAIMSAILFLSADLPSLARAAIFESGSQASLPLFPPERGETDWQNFVKGVASCADEANTNMAIPCLQNAGTEEIFAGLSAAAAETTVQFTWGPVLDGPGGLIPDLPSVLFARGQFAKLPFISGTNKDEGTIFTPTTINSTDELVERLTTMFTPAVSEADLNASIAELLVLYPDDPALGSPFGTGNQTFGLSPVFKRAAAAFTDLYFLALRRFWMETATNAGVATFGYHYTEPESVTPPYDGVAHGSDVPYVYGDPADQSPASIFLSDVIIDYWVSFATSLTPNDGHGVVPRPEWTQFTSKNKAVMQLNGTNLTMIPDDCRLEQTNFINSKPVIWRH